MADKGMKPRRDGSDAALRGVEATLLRCLSLGKSTETTAASMPSRREAGYGSERDHPPHGAAAWQGR